LTKHSSCNCCITMKIIFHLKFTSSRVCPLSCSSIAYALPKYDHTTKEHKLIFHVLPKLLFPLLRVNNNCAISRSSLPGSDNEFI
ncbi:hypothetical protein T09_7629, partial [Trichinella sp. T9]